MKKYEEISISEMLELKSDEYVVIDIRDEIAFTYGTINGAVNIPLLQQIIRSLSVGRVSSLSLS